MHTDAHTLGTSLKKTHGLGNDRLMNKPKVKTTYQRHAKLFAKRVRKIARRKGTFLSRKENKS